MHTIPGGPRRARHRRRRTRVPLATKKQLELIDDLSRQLELDPAELKKYVQDVGGRRCSKPEELSVPQASRLIDEFLEDLDKGDQMFSLGTKRWNRFAAECRAESEETSDTRPDMAGALDAIRAQLERGEEPSPQTIRALSRMIKAIEKLETAAESVRDRIRCVPQRELLNAVDEFLAGI